MRSEYEAIESQADLDALLERSSSEPVFLFKHSTTCPISAAAESEYSRFASSAEGVACGFLDLLAHRDLSNGIAASLGVRHESPQAILVVDGGAVWNASHGSITASSLASARDQAGS